MLLVEQVTGAIKAANNATARFYGVAAADLTGTSFLTFDCGPVGCSTARALEMPGAGLRCDHRTATGPRVVEVFATRIFSSGSALLHVVVQDIDDRAKAEARLTASEARFRSMFMSNPHPMWVYDVATLRFLAVNDSAIRHYGFSSDEFLGMTIADLRPEEDVPRLIANVAKVTSGIDEAGIWRHRKKSGEIIYVQIVSHVLDHEGRRAELVHAHDITDQVRSEQALRSSEERWKFALASTGAGIWDWSVAADKIVYTESSLSILGFRPGDAVVHSRSANWKIHPDDLRTVQGRLDACLRGETSDYVSEHRLARDDGTYRWVMERGRVVERNSHGQPTRVVGTLFDLSVHAFMSDSRQRLVNTALKAMPTAIVITNNEGTIEWVNEAFQKMTGYAPCEAIGANVRILRSGLHSADFYRDLWTTVNRGEIWQGEITNRRKDGSQYDEHLVIAPVSLESGIISHFVAIKQDISGNKELERRLLRAQRMESIGLLAGGIAHDLNNVLAPILLSAELLKDELKTEQARKAMSLMDTSARRGAAIVRQVLAFARGVDGERLPLRVGDLLREITAICGETFPKNIQISSTCEPRLPIVSGDATQLHQVLLNLAVNARDAMPSGGTLHFAAELRTLEADMVGDAGEAKRGRYVRISVQDSGCGMSPEVLEKVFDPFFTTKPRGKGTGLGLPTVVGIVKSHGGFIKVKSAVGKGSTFHVSLPVIEVPAPQDRPESPRNVVGRLPGTRVLICDDEQMLRKALRSTLELLGAKVSEAENGAEAVELVRAAPQNFDALIIDLMMPGLDGGTAASQIRKFAATLPIIIMSGLLEDSTTTPPFALGAQSPFPLLRKPFDQSSLQRVLAEACTKQLA